jgi:hypothetical protein
MKTMRYPATLLVLWTLALVAAAGLAQSGEAKAAGSERLEGSWAITVTPVVPPGAPPVPSFVTHLTVSSGGALVGTDRTRPFASIHHGSWERTAPKEYATTAVSDIFDATGTFVGVLTVRQKIMMTGPDSFVGVANVLMKNPAGETVFERCATTEGTRITVEDFTLCEDLKRPNE